MNVDAVVPGRGSRALKAALVLMDLVAGCSRLVHHDSERCQWGAGNCKRLVALAIRNFLLRHLPTVPVASRWTKIESCVDSIVGGVLCGDTLPHVFDVAFAAMGRAHAAPVAVDGTTDFEEWQDQQWHHITS